MQDSIKCHHSILVFHQIPRQILACFPCLWAHKCLGLTFRSKIFWRSGLTTALDSWALMALFLPHCDLLSVPDLACEDGLFAGLFRAFPKLYNELPWGGEMREMGLGLGSIFIRFGLSQVTLKRWIKGAKQNTFSPQSPSTPCRRRSLWGISTATQACDSELIEVLTMELKMIAQVIKYVVNTASAACDGRVFLLCFLI